MVCFLILIEYFNFYSLLSIEFFGYTVNDGRQTVDGFRNTVEYNRL